MKGDVIKCYLQTNEVKEKYTTATNGITVHGGGQLYCCVCVIMEMLAIMY